MILTKKKLYSLVKEKLNRSVGFRFFSGGSKTSPSSELISKLEPAEVAEVVEVSQITDSMLSCLQDPVIQSTLLFVGVVVGVVCWQQFAVAAMIQSLLCTVPPFFVEPVSVNVRKILAISCVDLENKGVKINIGFNLKGDIYIARYHDGKAVFDLEEFLTKSMQEYNSTPQAVEKMINALDTEIPNFLIQFGKMLFKDPDCLITQIVVKKADYLYYIAFYPGC